MTEHVFPDGRRVQSGFETVYTVEQTAALVEEIKAKTYDGVKARVLSLLEALLQAKGMGDSHAGRVLDILLRDVDRQILDTAAKHVPEITPALLDERRKARDAAAEQMDYLDTEERIRFLRDQADRLERNTEERRVENVRVKVFADLRGAESTTFERVAQLLSRGTETAGVEPGPFAAAIQRGKRAFDQIDAREKK